MDYISVVPNGIKNIDKTKIEKFTFMDVFYS
jgi:hypothetical protein